jgi:hypothetical protein
VDVWARLRPWLFLVLVVSAGTFLLLAAQAEGDHGWWLLGASIFQGVLIAVIVWREKETPASAWHRLKQPPRQGL